MRVKSSYRSPWWLRNGHLHTLYPACLRSVPDVRYQRERLELPDGDFLDLDRLPGGRDRAVVIVHGLEGSSQRAYVRGMARAFHRHGWTVVAMNCRGCSGEPNRLLRFYHSGVSEDLWAVAQHLHASGFARVGLVGFSLGGNMTLKLMGELGSTIPDWIIGAVGISVPCDLRAASLRMGRFSNRIYMRRFLRDLRVKIRAKMAAFPGRIDDTGYERLRTFKDFDDRYTAPLHGFRDAEDYWDRSGALRFLPALTRPALLLNAWDDPFLAGGCFPDDLAARQPQLHLETPEHGGHVGFLEHGGGEAVFYSERRAVEFLEDLSTCRSLYPSQTT